MSGLVAVKQYARDRMKALKFNEWIDGFNFEDVPSTLLDKSYHVEYGNPASKKISVDNQELTCPLTVRLWFSSQRNVKVGIDEAIKKADPVIAEFIAAKNRLTQTNGVKNCLFRDKSVDPLSDSNDNGVIVKIDFQCLVILSLL